MTMENANRADHIYEEATPIRQGKMRRKKPTVHSKIEIFLYLFQYQRDKKTYIFTWTFFLRKWFNIYTQEDRKIIFFW